MKFVKADEEAVGNIYNIEETFTQTALPVEAHFDAGRNIRDRQKEGTLAWMMSNAASVLDTGQCTVY
jgi:hypothetical protein